MLGKISTFVIRRSELSSDVLMSKKWEDVITKELGVLPIHINSNLVSGQNRDRLYWTNIPGVELPKDKKIMLSDIIKGGTGYGIRGRKINGKNQMFGTKRNDGKSNCLVTQLSNTGRVMMKNKQVSAGSFANVLDYCIREEQSTRYAAGRLSSKLTCMRWAYAWALIEKKGLMDEWIKTLYYGAKKEFRDTNGPFVKIY